MSFLAIPFRTFLDFVRPVSQAQKTELPHPPVSRTEPRPTKRSANDAFHEVDNLVDTEQANKKQRHSNKKHVKRNDSAIAQPDGSKLYAKEQAISGVTTNIDHMESDRNLMPPPSSPQLQRSESKRQLKRQPRNSLGPNDTASLATRSTRFTRGEVTDEYNMEEARRRAAATQLPPNSGIWETDERELFFHLSYRGFEPLLPNNWMLDFPTLPLSVFVHQELDEPLIECHRSTEFRAIKALQELLDTGTMVRDRLYANSNMRGEPILERATKRFMAWAFQDLGLPTRSHKSVSTPVYTIATMRPGQTTQHVLRQLSKHMHLLAQRHREELHIRTSIEKPDEYTFPNGVEGMVQTPTNSDHGSLPVIYGIMICSSIIAIFTLNSHMAPPTYLLREMQALSLGLAQYENFEDNNNAGREDTDQLKVQHDDDSGIRYIAQFDFSDPTADVWNAFVVAITAMQIRKTMALAMETRALMLSRGQEQGHGVEMADESWLSNVTGNEELSS